MAKINEKQYIIAIGASAGGLEAISAFFDYTPLDAVSYIIIQHLSSDFKSHMANILAPHSKLRVIEAVENVTIKPNTVYLIPSSKFMTVEDGRLLLSDKADQSRPYMTIDYFFASLAKERGDKAIGIILSGTGNDGSKGILNIKEAGGIVLVQDPDTASFNGMPMAALATGCSDLILSPQAMPQVIEDYVKDGMLELLADGRPDVISEAELSKIFDLIKGNLPLDFSDYKRPTIIRRIKRRMVEHNFSKIDLYLDFLKSHANEVKILANDFLISVTAFFRDPEAFKMIEEKIIPDMINSNNTNVLKIWVAGCATGEEAYTLAMLTKEYSVEHSSDIEIKIFATDINKAALDTASKGIYDVTIEQTVSKKRLERFFTWDGKNYRIKSDIRKMLIFAQHDLVKNPPYCNIDLISCRNLLIYLNVSLQKKVLGMMHFGLKKGGYLFLGPSENAAILREDFDEISAKWNVLQSNKAGRAVKFDTFSSHVIEGAKTTTIEVSKKSVVPISKSALADQINNAVFKASGFNGVCTDEDLTVIQSFGDTTPYLKSINFNHNLNQLLPETISIAFRAAAHKALKMDEKVVLNKIIIPSKGRFKAKTVNIFITPFFIEKSEARLLIVEFSEKISKMEEKNIINVDDINEVTKEHVISLEHENAELKQNLSVAHESIASSNENMQSYNEELQSANEEMQSANEEMQSTNEELQSVNEELQTINKDHHMTIDELTDLNDDLNNYFRSNTNGQLFVDQDLLLKRYSPGAVKHINIREGDIGRPLSNITTNIKLETLIQDIKDVINDEKPVTREVESRDGKIYQVMTMPYLKRNSKKANGAIVSFYDITALKILVDELDKSNQSFRRINEDLNNFVYGASHDLNAPILNIETLMGMLNKKIGIDNPDVVKLSGMMNHSLNNFKEVIKELGKVGTLESESMDETGKEDFISIFKGIEDAISERIKKAEATITTDFQEDSIRFPKKNLRSILLNLITNAIKFSFPNRKPIIHIETKKVDGFILLIVTDNGIGIKRERLNFVFKMYHRINEDIEGQGIGLFLLQKIINASGGKIEVESEVDKGSTFKIYFKA
ncbi:chemotaxis protein CheB [Pedobacter mendelii]|uniref:protein-glutamate O-methyltransferase n=1 Tax=Pedobacter mendelii TaxID=1908240 RepID=A0ABQ2BMI9_9SPHI|nr:chemotaxis protein CheB [Pedobacter mendelii]GGI28701.1 chemotaxis protein CheR [Pedobacter mendelii]